MWKHSDITRYSDIVDSASSVGSPLKDDFCTIIWPHPTWCNQCLHNTQVTMKRCLHQGCITIIASVIHLCTWWEENSRNSLINNSLLLDRRKYVRTAVWLEQQRTCTMMWPHPTCYKQCIYNIQVTIERCPNQGCDALIIFLIHICTCWRTQL